MANIFTRRNILKMISLLIPSVFLYKFLSPNVVNQNNVSILISDLPISGIYILKDKKIGIINNNGKIECLSIVCTHLGCTLNVAGDKLVCPCHGSAFTLNGDVIQGPANKALKKIPFFCENGVLKISLNK